MRAFAKKAAPVNPRLTKRSASGSSASVVRTTRNRGSTQLSVVQEVVSSENDDQFMVTTGTSAVKSRLPKGPVAGRKVVRKVGVSLNQNNQSSHHSVQCPESGSLPSGSEKDDVLEDGIEDEEGSAPNKKTKSTGKNRGTKGANAKNTYNFRPADANTAKFPPDGYPEDKKFEATEIKSPREYFEHFFTADMYDLFVSQTNLYSEQKGKKFRVTVEDIKKFVSVEILMGIGVFQNNLPTERKLHKFTQKCKFSRTDLIEL